MCQADGHSRELWVGCPVDSQSHERNVGCLAQGMGCGELGEQEAEEGKSRRTPAGYRRINNRIRG